MQMKGRSSWLDSRVHLMREMVPIASLLVIFCTLTPLRSDKGCTFLASVVCIFLTPAFSTAPRTVLGTQWALENISAVPSMTLMLSLLLSEGFGCWPPQDWEGYLNLWVPASSSANGTRVPTCKAPPPQCESFSFWGTVDAVYLLHEGITDGQTDGHALPIRAPTAAQSVEQMWVFPFGGNLEALGQSVHIHLCLQIRS